MVFALPEAESRDTFKFTMYYTFSVCAISQQPTFAQFQVVAHNHGDTMFGRFGRVRNDKDNDEWWNIRSSERIDVKAARSVRER